MRLPTEPNPYQSPKALPDEPTATWGKRANPSGSVFMIVVGLLLFVVSFYPPFLTGLDRLLSSAPYLGPLPYVYVAFVGCAGGITSLLHLLYLLTGWPKQHSARVLAIGIAVALAGCALAILRFVY